MTNLTTGAFGRFEARHIGFEGVPHAHIWLVEAEIAANGSDARVLKGKLDRLLSRWEGTDLPADVQLNEDIAAAIGRELGCTSVRVSRPTDGIYARWSA